MKKSILLPVPKSHFTQPVQTITALFLIFLCGCKKNPVNHTTVNNIRQEFTVVETASNIPIPGVTVSAYKCTSSGWTLCSGPGDLLATAITDVSGKVVFNIPDGVFLKLHKDNYWPAERNGGTFFSTNFELTPLATLKVRFKQVNPYPHGYLLNLRGGASGCLDCLSELTQLQEPREGTVYLKGAGNIQNYVSWQVDSGGLAPWNLTQSIMINRFDTAEFVIQY